MLRRLFRILLWCLAGLAVVAASGYAVFRLTADPPPEEILASLAVAPDPVLSPEEELATFEVPPGFRVELVAAEPLIVAVNTFAVCVTWTVVPSIVACSHACARALCIFMSRCACRVTRVPVRMHVRVDMQVHAQRASRDFSASGVKSRKVVAFPPSKVAITLIPSPWLVSNCFARAPNVPWKMRSSPHE